MAGRFGMQEEFGLGAEVAGGGMSAADLRALREELVADDPAALNSNLRAGAVRPPSKLTAAEPLPSSKLPSKDPYSAFTADLPAPGKSGFGSRMAPSPLDAPTVSRAAPGILKSDQGKPPASWATEAQSLANAVDQMGVQDTRQRDVGMPSLSRGIGAAAAADASLGLAAEMQAAGRGGALPGPSAFGANRALPAALTPSQAMPQTAPHQEFGIAANVPSTSDRADYGLAVEVQPNLPVNARQPLGPPVLQRKTDEFGFAAEQRQVQQAQQQAHLQQQQMLAPASRIAPMSDDGYGLRSQLQMDRGMGRPLPAYAPQLPPVQHMEPQLQPMGQYAQPQANQEYDPMAPLPYPYSMQQQQAMQGPPVPMYVPELVSLDALPPDQRFVTLTAPQATSVTALLAQQGIATQTVDLAQARDTFLAGTVPPRLAYVSAVETATAERRLPLNCKPSLLQSKLKQGSNKLVKLVQPMVEPGSQGFVDLAYTPEGALAPETSRVWQFALTLVSVEGLGKTGLRGVRTPYLYTSRMCVFDKRANRFVGNVLGVRPNNVTTNERKWAFDESDKVDPQSGTQLVSDDALSLYVEFNIAYRLLITDTAYLPASEAKCSQIVDELTTCWAMVSFKKCAGLTNELQISVPLYYGSMYDPQPLDALYEAQRAKTPFRSAFKPKRNPTLVFRAGPLSTLPPPLVPYAFMPTTMLCMHDLGTALGAYRMCLALSLARQAGPFVALAEPVLTAFPGILQDHHLLREFLVKWSDTMKKMAVVLDRGGCCAPEVLPPLPAVVEAFRRCVIEIAPLLCSPTIPPKHINNFIEYQGHRLKLVQNFCHVFDPKTGRMVGARHPVEPLSHAGFEFLHEPFDVSEIRLCMADQVEQPSRFYRS